MDKFKFYNKVLGWTIFAIALATYTLTMEPTGSLWDCGEFLSGANKLQVVHPPGAPLFLMVGRLFMMFASPENAAMMVNFMSALCTAFCSLFFFWSLTILMRNAVVKENEEMDTERSIAILGSAFVAALGATFLDSMWFSAVEGEVYALSVFFMTINIWAGLKWFEDRSETADRWLIFIGLSTGLSIGVHLLSLLVFPMIGIVYYFKNFKPSWKGVFIAFTASVIGIFAIMKFIIYGIPQLMASTELMMVNSFGMPFNSGVLVGGLIVTGIFGYLIFASNKNRSFLGWNENKFKISLNTVVLAFAMIVIGFSSYIMVPIRATAQPAINMNAPGDMMSMNSYINREQYGDRPLVKGPGYTATQYELEEVKKKGKIYKKNEKTGRYEEAGDKYDYVFKESENMLFPRMGFWMEERYKQAFRAWLHPDYGIADRAADNQIVKYFDANQYQAAEQYAQELSKETPGRYFVKDDVSMKDNLRFFFQYQIGFMYFRYLMWNFAGRTDDPQGIYANDEGRWQSGIPFIDELVGSTWGNANRNQEGKPAYLTANRANNKFYLIPFILCVIGFVWHFKKNPFNFSIILILFFTTGLMQVVFHNQPPIEPRERDYVYAPSFWAFAFWLGFGCYAIYEFLKNKKFLSGSMSAMVAILLSLSAPILMGSQGWDDHDRSDRYTTVAFAKNMLMSCDQNAILFTYGDNDTYPLWYAQEVEGYRTDVRVVNLSLLGVDWYINQLRMAVNKSTPLKLTIPQDAINGNQRDMLRFAPKGFENERIELTKLLAFVSSNDPSSKTPMGNDVENFIPSTKVSLAIDAAKTRANNIIPEGDMPFLAPQMEWNIPSSLQKNDLMTLDIVANNMFDRPICFAISCSPSAFIGLDNYTQMDGLIYRIVPAFNPAANQAPKVNIDKMYPRLMSFVYGNMDKHPVLMDENTMRGLYNMKTGFAQLANALLMRGSKDSAAQVVDNMYKHMPRYNVQPDRFETNMPQVYFIAGQREKALKLTDELAKNAIEQIKWATNSDNRQYVTSFGDTYENLQTLNQLAQICGQYGETKKSEELTKEYQSLQSRMQ
ncbi:MAG: DUF2723 domain-containing protein [Chitinophagales bacterium]|nr:DUF2723 domain-containing protein [Chitinophagales bacterium]